MSLQDQVAAKASVLADQQAQILSAQIAAALTTYQTQLVATLAGKGITLATPLPFTQAPILYQFLLPIFQAAFTQAFLSTAETKLASAGLT